MRVDADPMNGELCIVTDSTCAECMYGSSVRLNFYTNTQMQQKVLCGGRWEK